MLGRDKDNQDAQILMADRCSNTRFTLYDGAVLQGQGMVKADHIFFSGSLDPSQMQVVSGIVSQHSPYGTLKFEGNTTLNHVVYNVDLDFVNKQNDLISLTGGLSVSNTMLNIFILNYDFRICRKN